MKPLLPPPLPPGARIGVAAPSGPIGRADLARGLAYLTRRGYRLREGRHLRARHAYLAGTDYQRASDLNRLLSDPRLDAVIFARGGYGMARILERLDFSPLLANPKLFVGFSDITAFFVALQQKTGIPGFYGPMVRNYARSRSGFDERSLWKVLERKPGWNRFPLARMGRFRSGVGRGRLVGGCLSILVSLIGTPYDLDTRNTILFWEEVGEEPYKIDRLLNHLRMAGKLQGLRGMVVGKLAGCGPQPGSPGRPLKDILADHLKGTSYPVVLNFPAGHTPGKVTLPLGLPACLDASNGVLEILPKGSP